MANINGAAKQAGRKATGTTARNTGRSRLVTGLVVVVLLAGLVVAGVFGWSWNNHRKAMADKEQALAAARQTVVNFVSVSAASVDGDLQRIVAGATGDFRDEFTRGMPQVRSAVVDNNVESHGTVLRAGVVPCERGSTTTTSCAADKASFRKNGLCNLAFRPEGEAGGSLRRRAKPSFAVSPSWPKR